MAFSAPFLAQSLISTGLFLGGQVNTREEILQLNEIDLYANPLDQEGFKREMASQGSVKGYEVKFRRKGGTELHCMLTSTVRRGDDGSLLGYQGMIRDITELKRAQEAVQEGFQKLRRSMEGTVLAMASTVEMRDPYTAGHQRRVAQLASAIASEMGLAEEQVEGIHMAALLHDVGKISVPFDILNKPGKITEIEFSLIKTHPQIGYDILKRIDFPWPIAQIVVQHHERMDGSGYPASLSGEDLNVGSKDLIGS